MSSVTAQEFSIGRTLGMVFDGHTLGRDESREVMGQLMDGKLSQMQAAALLAAIRTRGETVEEIIGFAQAMRERAVRVAPAVTSPLVDTCGTGGTGFNSINVSTTAAFIAAAAGAKVAKHGNNGVTKRSGSADLLEALGVNLDLPQRRVEQAIEEVGLAFIYARNHHPSMKFVAPIRADLQARTIFNNLGPLTNPANASRQLLGVFSAGLTRQLAQVLRGLGVERALLVHGDGLDDFTVTGETVVAELAADGSIDEYTLAPEDVGLGRYAKEELLGGDPLENARHTREILTGRTGGAKRDVVLFNAGAALYLADVAATIRDGVVLASELLESGAAARKLEEFVAFTQEPDQG